MATRRKTEDLDLPRRAPATTPQQREDELISMAFDAVEEKIRTKQATSQELVHFLKLGSSREKLEQERIAMSNQLDAVKMDALRAQQRTEELFAEALSAMRRYQGEDPVALNPGEHEEDY